MATVYVNRSASHQNHLKPYTFLTADHVMFVLHHESVVRQLLTWFQLHLENCVPDQAPLEFWPMLHQLVLRGQVDAALQHIEKGVSFTLTCMFLVISLVYCFWRWTGFAR